jgi:hypothetical protein
MLRHFFSCNVKSQAPFTGSHWKIVTKTEQIHMAAITDAVMCIRRRKNGVGSTLRYDAIMEALVMVTAVT